MPRFILIQESTHTGLRIGHACHVTTDEIRDLVDVRRNPGGYTDVARCMAMIQNPAEGAFKAFPFMTAVGPATIHVEGRMDLKNHGLFWKEAGHRCSARCITEAVRSAQKAMLPGMPKFKGRF